EAFFLANNPHANGRFVRTNIVAPRDYPRIRALPEGQQEAEWYHLAFRFIRRNPGRAIHNWLRDAGLFVSLKDDLVGRNVSRRGRVRPPLLDDRWLWPAAAVGIAVAIKRRGRIRGLIPAVVVLYFVGFFML